METMRSWNWEVGWACPERESTAPVKTLAESGVSLFQVNLNDCSANDLLKDFRPDVVIFDSFIAEEQWSWRVTTHCPEALRITDSQDFHSLRLLRKQLNEQGTSSVSSLDEHNFVDKPLKQLDAGASWDEILYPKFDYEWTQLLREISSFHRSDLVFIVSDFELELLCREFGFPREKFVLVPFLYDDSFVRSIMTSNTPNYNQQKNIFMLGHMLYPPNADAVRWVRSEVWPQIREMLPDVQLHVYGTLRQKVVDLF